MTIDTTDAQEDLLERVWAEIGRLGLEINVAELEAFGYTIIPPERAAPPGLADRLLAATLDIAEARTGVRPDLVDGSTHAGYTEPGLATFFPDAPDSPLGNLQGALLFEDPVFEEALMNPVSLALQTYMLGHSCVLSSMTAGIKGPNKASLKLHTDTSLPSPLTPHALVANTTYALTDYSHDNGALVFVPGSHRWCRWPEPNEALVGEGGNPRAVAVECAAGSLIVWHGNTWHGALPRSAPGLRVNLILYFTRQYMKVQDDIASQVPQEALDRNDERFAKLVGTRNHELALALNRGMSFSKYA